MKLIATIRTRPEPGAKNVDGLQMDVIAAESADYDDAYTELTNKTPDGWQMLSVRRT